MLSLTVTVIPFLLETLISVENVTEWMFGPEYVFQLNNTIIVYTDRIEIQDITAIVNCRLKESAENNLCCHAHEIIISMMMRPVYENMSILKISRIRHIMSFSSHVITNKVPDQLFEIEFGRLGVRVFEMKTSSKSKHAHLGDSIIDAIEQFHIGIDLSVAAGESMKNYENVKNGSHVISSFPQNENTLRAYNCTTSCIITYTPSNEYNKDGEFEVRRNKTKFDFHLKLLPISYTNPNGKTFSIERTRMACSYNPQYLSLFDKNWKIHNVIEYFNKMEIRDKEPKFTSHTHLDGNVFFPNTLNYFSIDVHLHLLRIIPAQTNYASVFE